MKRIIEVTDEQYQVMHTLFGDALSETTDGDSPQHEETYMTNYLMRMGTRVRYNGIRGRAEYIYACIDGTNYMLIGVGHGNRYNGRMASAGDTLAEIVKVDGVTCSDGEPTKWEILDRRINKWVPANTPWR